MTDDRTQNSPGDDGETDREQAVPRDETPDNAVPSAQEDDELVLEEEEDDDSTGTAHKIDPLGPRQDTGH